MAPTPIYAFVKIDEQGWYCHFRTTHRGLAGKIYWWFGCQLIMLLGHFKSVEIINTYSPDGGEKVTRINK